LKGVALVMGLDELASARRSPTRQQATRSRRR
jgi:hypothetical protein